MSHRRMLGLPVLAILSVLLGHGCGQTSDGSASVASQATTSTSPVSASTLGASAPLVTAIADTPTSPAQGTSLPNFNPLPGQPPSASTPTVPAAPQAPIDSAPLSSSETSVTEVASDSTSVNPGTTPSQTASTQPISDRATSEGEAHTSEPEATGGGPRPEEVNVINGQGGVVNATITVRAGEIFDGGGTTFTAGSALGDGSQNEDQQPVFRLEDGAELRNVTLGSPAADGIHCYGDVSLKAIHWQDIGEDALTIKEPGTVVLDGGSARNGDDKVFQINAASTFIVRNFNARNAGKFIRQNGDTTFRVDVVIENCDISQMDECIFRTDSSTSTVTMRDTRYSQLGDGLFVGVSANNITLSNNTEY